MRRKTGGRGAGQRPTPQHRQRGRRWPAASRGFFCCVGCTCDCVNPQGYCTCDVGGPPAMGRLWSGHGCALLCSSSPWTGHRAGCARSVDRACLVCMRVIQQQWRPPLPGMGWRPASNRCSRCRATTLNSSASAHPVPPSIAATGLTKRAQQHVQPPFRLCACPRCLWQHAPATAAPL